MQLFTQVVLIIKILLYWGFIIPEVYITQKHYFSCFLLQFIDNQQLLWMLKVLPAYIFIQTCFHYQFYMSIWYIWLSYLFPYAKCIVPNSIFVFQIVYISDGKWLTSSIDICKTWAIAAMLLTLSWRVWF